jgi:hypothetical protein
MSRRQTSAHATWRVYSHTLRVGLLCAALVVAGPAVYAQAPPPAAPPTVNTGAPSAPNPAPEGLRPQITDASKFYVFDVARASGPSDC